MVSRTGSFAKRQFNVVVAKSRLVMHQESLHEFNHIAKGVSAFFAQLGTLGDNVLQRLD